MALSYSELSEILRWPRPYAGTSVFPAQKDLARRSYAKTYPGMFAWNIFACYTGWLRGVVEWSYPTAACLPLLEWGMFRSKRKQLNVQVREPLWFWNPLGEVLEVQNRNERPHKMEWRNIQRCHQFSIAWLVWYELPCERTASTALLTVAIHTLSFSPCYGKSLIRHCHIVNQLALLLKLTSKLDFAPGDGLDLNEE